MTDNPIADALATLKKEMIEDPEYAWGWHCNIAQCSVAEGLDHDAANRAAARFMFLLFGQKLEDYKP